MIDPRALWPLRFVLVLLVLVSCAQGERRPALSLRQDLTLVRASEGPAAGRFELFVAHGAACPLMAQRYQDLKELTREWPALRISLVNAVANEDPQQLLDLARELALPFALYRDATQKFVRRLELKTITAVALYDHEQERVVYRGAIDDRVSFDYVKARAELPYLRRALAAASTGQKISPAATRTHGCDLYD